MLIRLFQAQSELMSNPLLLRFWPEVRVFRGNSIEKFLKAVKITQETAPSDFIQNTRKLSKAERAQLAIAKLRGKRMRLQRYGGVSRIYGSEGKFSYGVGRIIGGFQ